MLDERNTMYNTTEPGTEPRFPFDPESCRAMLRDLIDLGDIASSSSISEQDLLAELCGAAKRARLAASSRMDRNWQQLLRLNPLSPMPAWGISGRELEVVPHLSRRYGMPTDYQGITVTATAHAPACDRLSSVPTGGPSAEIVEVERFASWLDGEAERGAAAVRDRYGDSCDVVPATGTCDCLEGTLVLAPRLYPDQPKDYVYLVGEELQHRYTGLFEAQRFTVFAVESIEQISGIKELRWYHLGLDEICTHEPQHDAWDHCPEATADLTRECDRGCQGGCDWILEGHDGRARISLHGSDIDLGPAHADHAAALSDVLIPRMRI
jgi:hypothetical protein